VDARRQIRNIAYAALCCICIGVSIRLSLFEVDNILDQHRCWCWCCSVTFVWMKFPRNCNEDRMHVSWREMFDCNTTDYLSKTHYLFFRAFFTLPQSLLFYSAFSSLLYYLLITLLPLLPLLLKFSSTSYIPQYVYKSCWLFSQSLLFYFYFYSFHVPAQYTCRMNCSPWYSQELAKPILKEHNADSFRPDLQPGCRLLQVGSCSSYDRVWNCLQNMFVLFRFKPFTFDEDNKAPFYSPAEPLSISI